MAKTPELESLYQQAQSTLKARDYDHSADILKQILVIDENYKDASRLLAQVVGLKRRRWYNDPRIWGTLGGIVGITLLAWFATTLNWKTLMPSPTATQTRTQAPAATVHPTLTPTSTPTPVPLAWKRLYDGNQLERAQVTRIAMDPLDLDVIYAGTDGAGIYKSIDSGISWRPSFAGLGQASIKSLVVNPVNPNILYAVTGDGLYMSNDGAASWQARILNTGSGIVVDPNNSKHLYYVSVQDVFESFDEGQIWSEVKTSRCPDETGYPVIHPIDEQTIFASQGSSNTDCLAGVYASRDGGRTWEYLGLEYKYLSLAVTLDEQGEVILHAAQSGGNAIIFRTRDEGQNWEEVFPSVRLCGGSLWFNPYNMQVGYYWSECGPIGLWATTDAGQSWQEVKPLYGIPVTNLSISLDGSRLAAGGEGVSISTDGGRTWEDHSDGIGMARLYLEQDTSNPSVLYARTGCRSGLVCNFYRSADGGQTWSEVTLEGNPLAYADVGAEGTLYAYDNTRATMWLSHDGGAHWQLMSVPWRIQGVFSHPYIPGFIIVFIEDPPYIGVTEDAGQTWKEAVIDQVQQVFSILFTSNSMDQIYLLTDRHQVYLSQDGGGTWRLTQESIWNNRSESWRIYDPNNNRRALSLGSQPGIFNTTDGGEVWQEKNLGLENLFVNSLAIDPQNPDVVYAGSDGGAYVSFDFGNTWAEINNGLLGANVIYSIVVDRNSNVYAATPYGIFLLEGR